MIEININIKMNALKINKSYLGRRYVMNYQSFQNELSKKIDDITLISSDKINESYNTTIDKLIESILIVEEKSKKAKLENVDINVSISVGPITIGISKKIGNNE